MPQRPLRICLIMHSTRSDNLGVGALTVAEVAILREIAEDLGRGLEITVVDWKADRRPYVTGPDITVIDMDRKFLLDPRGFLATVRGADLVIDIGAGDSFADIYGRGRLTRMFFMKYLTHLVGTPMVMAPQTMGPFTRSWSKRFALASLRWCRLVATRDAKSTSVLAEMGFRGQVIEASDVALRLPYDPPGPRAPDAPLRVGINVSGLLMNGGYTGQNEFGITLDYPKLMRDLIAFFQSEGAEVHLVAHVVPEDASRTHREDDMAACTALIEEYPEVVLAPRFTSPSAAKTYIAGLDFFMGARMHACIAAFSSGVPVVPMAYSRKFAGLFGSLGYPYTVDCTTQSDADVLAGIKAGFRDRARLKQEADAALAKGLEKLAQYEAGLKTLMVQL